jgi:hypothetical protein
VKISKKISRRGFLFGSLGILGVWIASPKLSFGLVSKQFQADPFCVCVVRMIEKIQSVKLIGKEYLAMCPQEYDPKILIREITHNSDRIYKQYLKGDSKKVHAILRQQIREDFGSDQKIILHGWVLSKTEARICGLAYLIG